MARFLAVCLLLALAACGGPAANDPAAEDARHRAELAAATGEARSRLAWFWEHAEAPEVDEYDFTLKVALPPPASAEPAAEPEEVWLEDVVRGGDLVSGVLSLKPQQAGFAKGDRIEVPSAAVLDWAFFRGEELIGHYTTRVLLARLPPEDADILRALLGDNPD